MKDEVTALMKILEFPNLKKSYISYLDHLEKMGKQQQYNVIKYLIEKKFHDNCTNFDTKR